MWYRCGAAHAADGALPECLMWHITWPDAGVGKLVGNCWRHRESCNLSASHSPRRYRHSIALLSSPQRNLIPWQPPVCTFYLFSINSLAISIRSRPLSHPEFENRLSLFMINRNETNLAINFKIKQISFFILGQLIFFSWQSDIALIKYYFVIHFFFEA